MTRAIFAILCVSLGLTVSAHTQTPASRSERKGAAVDTHASGTFEVKTSPLPADEKVEGLTVGRVALDKQFSGDIDGTSKGEMMTAATDVKGSAGYVAVERITGKLKGRSGAFTLLHLATMRRGGDFNMTLTVVPDSGTDQLAGLAGKMKIIIEGGKHSYEFDYTLPEDPNGTPARPGDVRAGWQDRPRHRRRTGLGQAMALALAEAGADVALAGRTLATCEEAATEIAAATGRRVKASPPT